MVKEKIQELILLPLFHLCFAAGISKAGSLKPIKWDHFSINLLACIHFQRSVIKLLNFDNFQRRGCIDSVVRKLWLEHCVCRWECWQVGGFGPKCWTLEYCMMVCLSPSFYGSEFIRSQGLHIIKLTKQIMVHKTFCWHMVLGLWWELHVFWGRMLEWTRVCRSRAVEEKQLVELSQGLFLSALIIYPGWIASLTSLFTSKSGGSQNVALFTGLNLLTRQDVAKNGIFPQNTRLLLR